MLILKSLLRAACALSLLVASSAFAQSASISNFTASPAGPGRWRVEFDYVYTGTERASLVIAQVVEGTGQPTRALEVARTSAQAGKHHFAADMVPPQVAGAVTTQLQAVLQFETFPPKPASLLASLDRRIRWPDATELEVEQAIAEGKPDRVVEKAADMIDTEQRSKLQEARTLLQALVERQPRVDGAYLELARIAMKTNWSPAGLREAEALIRSALQIRPDSANAKILLGYVMAHQGRLGEAEPLFAQAAASNPPNLWLWANWGELLAMQGKTDAAMQKYREALRRPRSANSYDLARTEAYEKLLYLAGVRNDVETQEALHKQRLSEYPTTGCFRVRYARFLVLQRADGAGASTVLRDTTVARCDQAEARAVQGLAHYVSWSHAQGAERSELLLRARAFLPTSPSLFQALASSDKTVDVARQLIAAGERLDVQDNRNTDALGYALAEGQTAVAQRLVRLGAKTDAPEGDERMPAALIPVLTGDIESIRMLRQAGVDYARLRFQGTTALDYARQRGDEKLLRALDPKTNGL